MITNNTSTLQRSTTAPRTV